MARDALQSRQARKGLCYSVAVVLLCCTVCASNSSENVASYLSAGTGEVGAQQSSDVQWPTHLGYIPPGVQYIGAGKITAVEEQANDLPCCVIQVENTNLHSVNEYIHRLLQHGFTGITPNQSDSLSESEMGGTSVCKLVYLDQTVGVVLEYGAQEISTDDSVRTLKITFTVISTEPEAP